MTPRERQQYETGRTAAGIICLFGAAIIMLVLGVIGDNYFSNAGCAVGVLVGFLLVLFIAIKFGRNTTAAEITAADASKIRPKKIHYDLALIGEYRLGRVVQRKHRVILDGATPAEAIGGENGFPYSMMVGHIIGFGFNTSDEVTLKVRWADGEEDAIHPTNVLIL